jgi:hypothetical protein
MSRLADTLLKLYIEDKWRGEAVYMRWRNYSIQLQVCLYLLDFRSGAVLTEYFYVVFVGGVDVAWFQRSRKWNLAGHFLWLGILVLNYLAVLKKVYLATAGKLSSRFKLRASINWGLQLGQ